VEQYGGDDSDFLRLRVWLRRQALVFAKGKLADKRQAMLRRLGVKLRVDLRVVQHYAQLQVRAEGQLAAPRCPAPTPGLKRGAR
jgi:hypothetical protein